MNRFLIVNPFGIGDAIFSMALVEALRRAKPDAYIAFVCNERTEPVVRMNRAIDRTIVFHRDRFRKLWKRHPFLFWAKLRALFGLVRAERFNAMIDLSLGREYALFGWLAGIRERVGFDCKGRGIFLTKKEPLASYSGRHVAELQLGLLGRIGIDPAAGPSRPSLVVPEAARLEADAIWKRAGFRPEDRIVAVAPGGGRTWGANAKYKQWDAGRFGEVAATLAADAHTKTLVLGDREEAPLLDQARSAVKAGSCAILAGERIDTVAACLVRCRALVANDGGLLHLANALGVRTVSLYGPVDEGVYGPFWDDVPREVLTEAVGCRPCYKDFRFPPCTHDRQCLDRLPVSRVVEAAKKIVC